MSVTSPEPPAPAPSPDTVAGAARTAPILPLIALGLGAYLLWFGVKYWKGSGAAIWPSYPIKNVLQGKGVPSNKPAPSTAAVLTSYEASIATQINAAGVAANPTGTGQKPGTTTAGGRGSGGGQASGSNVNRGKLLAAKHGWSSGTQWNDLYALWNAESGWSNTADTRKSGLDPPNATTFAYGIPQARPATKLPLAGRPPDLGGRSDPTAQIDWGLMYIALTYGTPSNAWAHEQSHGWY